jgi:tetratricopeptide (TPR) repeat protein
MFCPKCGTKNNDDALFCLECGASIGKKKGENQAKEENLLTQSPPTPTQNQEPSGFLPPKNQPVASVKSGKKILVIGIVAAVLVIAGGFAYMNTGARLASKQVKQGETYLEGKQYNEAIVEFENAIKTGKKTAKAYTGLADAYIGLKDTQSAEESLKSGISASPNTEELYLKMSGIYDYDGKTGEAVQVLETGYAVVKSQNIQTQLEKLQTEGNTQGNIVNAGIVAQKGDLIYYSNLSDNGYLYKIKTDGTGKTKLNSENSSNINVVDGWVYYMNQSQSNYYSLCKIQTDGIGETKLSSDQLSGLNVVGNWAYYENSSDNGYIYKIRTDGTGKTKLTSDKTYTKDSICVVENWIYYTNRSDNSCLYKIRLDGSGRTKLNSDGTYCINVTGDWIYYINETDNYSLYKIKTDGTGKTKLNSDESIFINVVGDWIYYNNYNDNIYLYKIRTDGTGKTKLNSAKTYCINVVGNWIYLNNSDNNYLYKIQTDGTENQLVN